MTLAPLLASPATVIVHTILATAALVLGAAVLFLRKGTPLHRRLGTIWAGSMMIAAAISLGIGSVNPGHFSFIHLLSAMTLVNIPYAIWMRRRGAVRAHAIAMTSNYAGLLAAGAFTLVPGRIMHAVVFG
ncbi:MAG: DUF2306 domain-containing protein [Roseiarcus sp.]